MDDLETLLVVNGVSEDGLKAARDAGIDMEQFRTFEEGDICDLFKSFQDRFRIRRVLKSVTMKEGGDDPTTEVSVDQKVIKVESQKSLAAHGNLGGRVSSAYSVEDMMSSKGLRGKTTPAQLYFAGILRDCAQTARIWKKAPLVATIPAHKKDAFFTALGNICPELLHRKQDVWNFLGKRLQNRRKYLLDKESGRRPSKADKIQTAQQSPPSDTGRGGKFNAGEVVTIKSRSGKILGKGLYIKQTSDIYAEVTLIKPVRDNIQEEDELPAKCGAATHFRDLKEKQLFVWKVERLEVLKKQSTLNFPLSSGKKTISQRPTQNPKAKAKTPAAVSYASIQKSAQPMVVSSATKPTTGTSTTSVGPFPSSTVPHSSKQTSARPMVSSATKPTTGTSTMSVGPFPSSTVPTSPTPAKVDVDQGTEDIVAFEWNSGKVFLGLRRKTGRKITVTSAGKPVAKITGDDKYTLATSDELRKCFTINKTDVQRNPNMEYLVWALPEDVCVISPDKQRVILVLDESRFLQELDLKMSDYVKY